MLIETQTVLLTSPTAALCSALTDARPDLRVVPLHAEVPALAAPGRLWAFVDWIPADCSGLELCRRLRECEATAGAHIVMVLEARGYEPRRRALAAGADDYVIAPLTARAILERMATPRQSDEPLDARRLRHGELSIDLAAFQARYRGQPLPLRPTEFRLLAHFVENVDRVQSRAALIRRLGKDLAEVDERTVDVWVGRLRRGLRAQGVPDPLRTVRSMGYVMDSISL